MLRYMSYGHPAGAGYGDPWFTGIMPPEEDPLEFTRMLLAPHITTDIGVYLGTEPLYAVVNRIDDWAEWSDNGVMLRHAQIQVDVWQRRQRPVDAAHMVELLLSEWRYVMMRASEGAEVVNGVKWLRISYDYNYAYV